MQGNSPTKNWTSYWEYIPFVLCIVSLFFSRFLLSVSVGLMLLYTVWFAIKRKSTFVKTITGHAKSLLILLSVWILFVLIDGFRSTDLDAWLTEFALKIPLLIVPLYVLALDRDSCRIRNIWLMFTIITVAVALISTINYWLHYEAINVLLLQSKHVPIFGNMHHIYFGIVMSLVVWVCVYYFQKQTYKKLWIACSSLLVFMLHILASRTGLVAFYVSVAVFGVAYIWQSKKYKLLVVGLVLFGSLPLIAYKISGSFRNKVFNSVEDFHAVSTGEDINYKSLAMRIEAWKTSLHVIEQNGLIGVGSTQIDRVMQKQYRDDKTVLYLENRVGPHNQFLEMTMAYGWLGGLLLICVVGIVIRAFYKDSALLALVSVFLLSFMLESVLERQQGILVFCLVIFSFIPVPSKTEKETQP